MRKNIFLVAVAVMLTSAAAFSQIKVALGAKAGLNFSSIDTKSTFGETYKTSTGFHGGLFATVKAAKFGVQPEVLFSRQGYVTEVSGQEAKSTLNYVNIPVMVKVYFAKILNVQVGPQFGMLTSAAREAADGTKTDVKDQLKGSDISLCAGLGLELPFKLNVDARYVLGLSDVNDVAGASESIKNRTIQVSVGYRFLDKGN